MSMINCHCHSESPWCYVNDDGQHIDFNQCRCHGWGPGYCPIDEHRKRAAQQVEAPTASAQRQRSAPVANQPMVINRRTAWTIY